MKLNFWTKDRKKDISSYTQVEISELVPKVDEEFATILQHKIDGVTTQHDECYLAEKIKKDEYCRLWYELKKAEHAEIDLGINCSKSRARTAILVLFVIVTGIAGICAVLYISGHPLAFMQPNPEVEQPDHGFYKRRVGDLIDSAKIQYGREIVLDQPAIADILCSGALDPAMSFEDFMENFTIISQLEFYSDSVNVIHIRKLRATRKIRK